MGNSEDESTISAQDLLELFVDQEGGEVNVRRSLLAERKRLSGLSGVARTAVENAIKRNESALKKLTVK